MNDSRHITDRSFITRQDYSFNIFIYLAKRKSVQAVIVFFMDIFLRSVRKIIRKNNKGSVVIIAFCRIGDTVFTVPAVREIIKLYQDSEVKLICYPESKKIYELVFSDIRISAIDKKNIRFGRRIADSHARRIMKEENPAVIYDITGTILSASLIFDSRAKEIYGSNERVFHKIYTKTITIRTSPHLIDRYMDIVEIKHSIENKHDNYEHKTEVKPDGYILIHPLSIRKAKEWNLNKYILLCTDLMQDYDVKMIIPSDSLDNGITDELKRMNIPLLISASMDELISYIKECSLYISNDTGPLYIANLIGKPTFTIYGPTNPAYSLPFGDNHRFINKIIGCSPIKDQCCYTFAGINCSHYDCMNLLEYKEVSEEVNKFIKSIGIREKVYR